MFLRGILRDFVEPFKTKTVQFHSWPKLGGVIRDHFFGVFSSWLPGMGGSKGQPWKLVSCCGFAQKDFLGMFFLAQMFWKKWIHKLTCVRLRFFVSKRGGVDEKNIS